MTGSEPGKRGHFTAQLASLGTTSVALSLDNVALSEAVDESFEDELNLVAVL